MNVTSRTDSDGTVTSFGYDASDQLTSESRDNSHSTGYLISYTFDHNQNRLTKVLGGVTDTYVYDSHDKLQHTSSKTFGYDGNGNCTSVVVGGATTSLTFDDSNRVTGITYPSTATNSFVYNGEDLRVTKTDSAGTSAVITDGTSPASPVLKDARAVYTPGLSERAGTTSKFYHGDALGSTRGITDGSQAVTDTVLYDAFGMTVSRTGTTATPFGFVGAQQYQSDADSGLQLLGHRMYDPSTGRFISSDPIQDGDNWYAYCENNPIDDVDTSGLAPHREVKGPRGGGPWNRHTGRRSDDKEKADDGRRPPPKKAGGGKSPKPDNPNIGNQGRDRGKRNEDPLPLPEPGVNPIYILPVAALPRVAPALPGLLPGLIGGAGRVLGGIGRVAGGLAEGFAGPIIIWVRPPWDKPAPDA